MIRHQERIYLRVYHLGGISLFLGIFRPKGEKFSKGITPSLNFPKKGVKPSTWRTVILIKFLGPLLIKRNGEGLLKSLFGLL